MRVRSLLSLGILLAVVGMSGNRDTEASRRNPDSVARPMRSMGPPSCPGMVPVVAVPEKSARDAELERPILAAVRALPRVVQAHAAVAMRTHDASSTAAHKAAVIAVYVPDDEGRPPLALSDLQKVVRAPLPDGEWRISALLVPQTGDAIAAPEKRLNEEDWGRRICRSGSRLWPSALSVDAQRFCLALLSKANAAQRAQRAKAGGPALPTGSR